MADEFKQALKRKGSFLNTLKAVAWSFFGVRKASDYEKDVQQLNPVHLVIAAVLCAACFIAVLVVIVKFVVSK